MSFHSAHAQPSEMEYLRSISSGEVSVRVVPSLMEPWRLLVPETKARASTSVVLPLAPCPTTAMLRIASLRYSRMNPPHPCGDCRAWRRQPWASSWALWTAWRLRLTVHSTITPQNARRGGHRWPPLLTAFSGNCSTRTVLVVFSFRSEPVRFAEGGEQRLARKSRAGGCRGERKCDRAAACLRPAGISRPASKRRIPWPQSASSFPAVSSSTASGISTSRFTTSPVERSSHAASPMAPRSGHTPTLRVTSSRFPPDTSARLDSSAAASASASDSAFGTPNSVTTSRVEALARDRRRHRVDLREHRRLLRKLLQPHQHVHVAASSGV